MTEASETTLDHVDDIRIPGKPFDEPANEYWELKVLWKGLEVLYGQARASDDVGIASWSKH